MIIIVKGRTGALWLYDLELCHYGFDLWHCGYDLEL